MNWSVVFSGVLTIALFFILHFIVTPYYDKRKSKIEQLTKLYAPLYGLLISRLEVGKKIIPTRLTLGSIKSHEFLTKSSFEKLIYENLGYASVELIEAWATYTAAGERVDYDLQEKIIKVVIKDYNGLRKSLRLPYNKLELQTGIPEVYNNLR